MLLFVISTGYQQLELQAVRDAQRQPGQETVQRHVETLRNQGIFMYVCTVHVAPGHEWPWREVLEKKITRRFIKKITTILKFQKLTMPIFFFYDIPLTLSGPRFFFGTARTGGGLNI